MPYIKQDFIDNLLRDSDIVEVFRHFGDEPKKKGTNFFCSSPFTDEKTGSCWVQPKTQIFKDFSSGKSGNAITYIKHKKNCSYPEAIEELAKISGKSIEFEKPELAQKYQEKQKKQKDLRKYLEALHKKFKDELHKLP